MNKSQEIAALSKFIDSLPRDSYLRAWMHYVLPEILRDIQNDVFPTVTPADSRQIAVEIEARAAGRAKDIIAKAEKQGEDIIEAALNREAAFESRIRGEKYRISRAMKDLETAIS